MNAKKAARPPMFDIANVIVKPPGAEEPAASVVAESNPHSAPSKPATAPAPENFRTSIYFSRAVHDKLRDIAHEERKTITDLINEGLDHVLTSRHYATVAELSGKKR